MKIKLIAFLALTCLLKVSVTSAAGFQNSEREYVIYNSFAYVIDSREMQFEPGTHSYLISNLPMQIQTETIFVDRTSRGVEILQQQFDSRVFNFNEILNDYRGSIIRLTLMDDQSITGTYYGFNGNEIILRNGGSFTSINRNRIQDYTIEGITNIAPFSPRLHLTVASSNTVRDIIRLHYLVNNIGWSGEYVGMYNPTRGELLLKSRARIRNNSGSRIETDKVILIAGEPHRAATGGIEFAQPRLSMKAAEQSMAFQVENVHIFHKFSLDQELNLENRSERQVRLFPDRLISVDQKFIFDVNRFGDKVMNVLMFTNDRNSGTGEPLPSGTVRIFESGDSGSIFLGEDNLQDTPLNGLVTIRIGVAFDITGTRTQKQFRRITDRIREEVYQIELENGSNEEKEVVVNEHFYGEWRIITSSEDYTMPDSRTAEFIVTIPPESKITINYTVRIN